MPPFLQGIFGASSLIIGACLALIWLPSPTISAAIMAFGSGTLLSALAFEITLEVYRQGGFFPLTIGFILGGFFFTFLTKYIDQKGGFLRNKASSRRYLVEHRQEQTANILTKLDKIEVIKNLTVREKEMIVPLLKLFKAKAGEVICREGEAADYLYLIIEGQAKITKGGKIVTMLKAGETFGEMSLLTGETKSASVIADTDMELFQLPQEYFNYLLDLSPNLAAAFSRSLAQRLKFTTESQVKAEKNLDFWRRQLREQVELNLIMAKEPEILKGLAKSSVPLAILIGSLIDNIPEATVIGINSASGHTGQSFLFAVFISNFPEALSSALGMKQAGKSKIHILSLWVGVVILSGFFALAGYHLHNQISEVYVAIVEAIAGGAILAMLASTMMPEAYELGGESVVFSTIAGFILGFWLFSWTFS